jgi:hypothetical protein
MEAAGQHLCRRFPPTLVRGARVDLLYLRGNAHDFFDNYQRRALTAFGFGPTMFA